MQEIPKSESNLIHSRNSERKHENETTLGFICASEGATSKHLRNYCREVYLLGYLPVCPKLQDSQYLVLEDAVERSEYTAIARDKLLRCPMLVVCSRNQDATTNAQIGLAQKYNRIVTTLDGLKKAVSEGDDLVS